MATLSVCIEMFWRDLPFDERIRRVKALGYSAFEFWGWKGKDLDVIRAAQDETGLDVAAICIEPNYSLVDRSDPAPLVDGVKESAAVAQSLGCSRMIVTTGNALADETYEITRRRVVRNLKRMAPVAEDCGVTLVLEPLNPIVDHKGYWLTTLPKAVDIVEEVDSPGLRILDDLYHQQLSEGNLIANLRQYISRIGHFHAAGAPGRHELVGGELDYRTIFTAIDATGYNGFVGLEFSPTIGSEEALKQALELVSP
ncbi:MAG: TIM barrel protein [Chloroflexi bacterium]|nr:TIM barrel protein [Chloroflexota bacterium]